MAHPIEVAPSGDEVDIRADRALTPPQPQPFQARPPQLQPSDGTVRRFVHRVRQTYFDVVVDEWGSRRWMRARIGSIAFMFLLGVPLGVTLRSDRPLPYKILILIAIFAYALCFMTVIWRNTPRLHMNRAPWVIVGSLVLSVPMLIVFGEQWLTLMIYLTTSMMLFNAGVSRWPYILVGLPVAEIVIGRFALGDTSAKPFTVALQALLIGAIQAAFYQQIEAKIELRRVRADLARLAVSEERLRISRDLHDILGQQLSAVSLKAELAARLVNRDATRAAAEMIEVAAIARAALSDVRETVAGYRQMSLSGETETARALLTAARMQISIDICELPPRLDVCGAWLIREAITNVIRHAGAARCEIRAARTLTSVVIEVRDDGGTASHAPTFGNGLTGLAERVSSERGELFAGRDGGWFVVRASFAESAIILPAALAPLGGIG